MFYLSMFDSWNTLCAIALADGKIYVPKNMDNPMKTGLFKISVEYLINSGIDLSNIKTVLVTHLHLDHFGGIHNKIRGLYES